MGQKFSRIGPYIKKVLQEVLSIPAFVDASHNIKHHKRWPALSFYMYRAYMPSWQWSCKVCVTRNNIHYFWCKQMLKAEMLCNTSSNSTLMHCGASITPVNSIFPRSTDLATTSFNHSMTVWPKKNCGTILCGLRNHFQTLYIQIHHNIVAWCSGSTWFFFLSKICWMI